MTDVHLLAILEACPDFSLERKGLTLAENSTRSAA
jgi:hypothetical protein